MGQDRGECTQLDLGLKFASAGEVGLRKEEGGRRKEERRRLEELGKDCLNTDFFNTVSVA